MASLLRTSTRDRFVLELVDNTKHSKTISLIFQFNHNSICPLQLAAHVVHIRHAGEQGTHWNKTNKELTSFKIVISFSSLVPVRPLLSTWALLLLLFFFNHVNGQLLRACGEGNFLRCTNKTRMLQETCQDSPHSKFNTSNYNNKNTKLHFVNTHRILHGKCGRTVFTHELLTYRVSAANEIFLIQKRV